MTKKQLNCQIDADLLARVKAAAAISCIPLYEWVALALAAYIKSMLPDQREQVGRMVVK